MRRNIGLVTALFLLIPNIALAQHLSYGVIAGVPLTDDFNSLYIPFNGPFSIIERSGGKNAIGGPSLEWSFSSHLSVEVDGIFRELRFSDANAGPHNPTVTWEFPILAKYRPLSYAFGRSSLSPFVEAGPSFRTTGNLNANPSHTGISAGAGLELHLSQLSITPTIRYTRWAADSDPNVIHSRPDQLEFLVDFSHSSKFGRSPFGNRLSVGVLLGVNLLGDYDSKSSSLFDITDNTIITFSSKSGPRSFLIGPLVEARLVGRLSIESGAIYRPVREEIRSSSNQFFNFSTNSILHSWQFPVLAKYKLPLPFLGNRLSPFAEAGPSFRIPETVSTFGFTAGTGVAARLGPITISPTLRYTRWQDKQYSNARPGELDLFVGITF